MKKFRIISLQLDTVERDEICIEDSVVSEKRINEYSSPINIITKKGGDFLGKKDIDLLPEVGNPLTRPGVSPGTSPVVIGDRFMQPPSPRTRAVRENSILYSLGRNGKILTFAHSDYREHKNHCINLRYENKYRAPPLEYGEYFHESNKYCICMITDYERKNVKVMGFVLYRKKYGERRITILDTIFYKNRYAVEKFFPEFADINLEVECLRVFSDFIDDIGYKCIWRPAIKWKKHIIRKQPSKSRF